VKSETKRTVRYSFYAIGGIVVFFGLMNVWKFALNDMPVDSATVGLVVVGSALLWIASELKR
jgi:bacteriorhodopsin